MTYKINWEIKHCIYNKIIFKKMFSIKLKLDQAEHQAEALPTAWTRKTTSRYMTLN